MSQHVPTNKCVKRTLHPFGILVVVRVGIMFPSSHGCKCVISNIRHYSVGIGKIEETGLSYLKKISVIWNSWTQLKINEDAENPHTLIQPLSIIKQIISIDITNEYTAVTITIVFNDQIFCIYIKNKFSWLNVH